MKTAIVENPVMAQTFGLTLRALDDLKQQENLPPRRGLHFALWGELMST